MQRSVVSAAPRPDPATREHQVLHGGIDRRAAHDGHAIEPRVGDREIGHVDADDDDRRRLVEVLREVIGRAQDALGARSRVGRGGEEARRVRLREALP
jgi:hypothetical protein